MLPDQGRNPGGSMSKTAKDCINDRRRTGEISRESARLYKYAILSFERFTGPIKPRDVDETIVRDWLESIEHRTPATRSKYLQVVKAYFTYLHDEGYLRKNPIRKVKGPRVPDRLPRTVAGPQVAATFAEVTTLRDQLIVSLAVQEGLRTIEISRLHTRDLDSDGVLRIYGKGDKERSVPISPATRRLWTQVRVEDPRPGPIIRHSQAKEPLGIGAPRIGVIVAQAMRSAGVKQEPYDGMGAHALRRTFATDAIDDGADLYDVMELMGHAQLSSFRRYARPPKARLAAITARKSYQQAS